MTAGVGGFRRALDKGGRSMKAKTRPVFPAYAERNKRRLRKPIACGLSAWRRKQPIKRQPTAKQRPNRQSHQASGSDHARGGPAGHRLRWAWVRAGDTRRPFPTVYRFHQHSGRRSANCARLFSPRRAGMSFRPLHDRVLIRRVGQEEKSRGGIIIPDTAQEKPMEGEIVAVGPAPAARTVRCNPWRSRPATACCSASVRHRGQARRRRADHHERIRHHGHHYCLRRK